ncbi:hypothetical protein [Actinopolymorpha pittospori]
MLTYGLNPPTPFAGDDFDHVTADTLVPPFESLFEQRVCLKMCERGYHVVPQVEVNGRRIALVVTGANGRLAVECDSDFWHSTPEDRENDFDRERELKRAPAGSSGEYGRASSTSIATSRSPRCGTNSTGAAFARAR